MSHHVSVIIQMTELLSKLNYALLGKLCLGQRLVHALSCGNMVLLCHSLAKVSCFMLIYSLRKKLCLLHLPVLDCAQVELQCLHLGLLWLLLYWVLIIKHCFVNHWFHFSSWTLDHFLYFRLYLIYHFAPRGWRIRTCRRFRSFWKSFV